MCFLGRTWQTDLRHSLASGALAHLPGLGHFLRGHLGALGSPFTGKQDGKETAPRPTESWTDHMLTKVSASGAYPVLLKCCVSSKVGCKSGQLKVTLALDNCHTREASGQPGCWRAGNRCFHSGGQEGLRERRESKRQALMGFQHDFESCHSGCNLWTKSDPLVKTA